MLGNAIKSKLVAFYDNHGKAPLCSLDDLNGKR